MEGTEAFIGALEGSDVEAACSAAERIGDMCREEENRGPCSPTLPVLLKLLERVVTASGNGQAQLRLKRFVPRAIANLCFNHAENRATSGAAAPLLVPLIDDEDDLVSRNASGACANLLSQADEPARLVVAAGAIPALCRALARPQSLALAVRGLNNAAELEEVALQCSSAISPLVHLCKDGAEGIAEEASDALLNICRQSDNGRQLATDADLLKILVQCLKLDSVASLLAALCDIEGLRVDLSQLVWGDLEGVVQQNGVEGEAAAKCLALLSVAAPARVLASPKFWLELIGEDKSEGFHVAGLMGLGNAACTEANVHQFAAVQGLVEAIMGVLHNDKATTNELHLAIGVLGNLAVPLVHRARLVQLGAVKRCSSLIESNNNAHVLFAAAQLIRRLCANDHDSVRPFLDSIVAQRERLTQPEHQRIWLEISRIVCINATSEYLKDHLFCVEALLSTDYSPLQVEACRAITMAPSIASDAIVKLLFKLGQQSENRLQAAAALHAVLKSDPLTEQWKELLGLILQLTQDEKLGKAARELAKTLDLAKELNLEN